MIESGFYNMDKEYVVYRHISPSGKSYIGITSNYTKRVRDKALAELLNLDPMRLI